MSLPSSVCLALSLAEQTFSGGPMSVASNMKDETPLKGHKINLSGCVAIKED